MGTMNRRHWLGVAAAGAFGVSAGGVSRAAMALPRNDPAAHLDLGWTAGFKWNRVVDITAVGGRDWDERFRAAQRSLMPHGGVVFFPPGTYQFADHLRLGDGVVLRGADPKATRDARSDRYSLPSRLIFPRYQPSFTGQGTPIETAFKGIYLENPARGSYTGVVNLHIEYGHIHLLEDEQHRCGECRIVFGCIVRNAAVADPAIPNVAAGQKPWQRFTARHHAAIDVKAARNLLVANNRLPKSGEANFVMRGYVLKKSRGSVPVYDVEFDYDNRPGLYVNHFCVGGPGGSGNDGTPESHPYGFRRGIVIVGNYVFNTGRMAIGFCGDGVYCARNVTRMAKDVWRPTVTGLTATTGASTNDNRAIEMRGWRWVVEDNDCEVHRNWCADRSYQINDGEGLMHEDHCNSTVLQSRLVGNRVNSYLSIYKCGPIDGLVIEGNDVSVSGKIADIYVVSNRNSGPQPCHNVAIVRNVTHSNGILLAGHPASGNRILENVHKGARPGFIRNEAAAVVRGNINYA